MKSPASTVMNVGRNAANFYALFGGLFYPLSLGECELAKVVIKRDGKRVPYDESKIVNAIMRAQESIGMSNVGLCMHIAAEITLATDGELDIPKIQEIVERRLKDVDYKLFKSYSTYRKERDRVREAESDLAKELTSLVDRTDPLVLHANANKDSKVFPVMRDLMAGMISKHFAHKYMPKHILDAHFEGDIHFHDLDYSPYLPFTNCCLVDLKGLLTNGFRLGSAHIDSPKSFGVACAVTCQLVAQVASHQYGGTTIANIDQVLEPYAKASWGKHYDRAEKWGIADPDNYVAEMTSKEIYDGVQAMEYEINTLFTTNGQQPFTTFTFGMGTGWFCKEIQKAILSVRLKGLGKNGITAVFPKLVMFVEDGLNLKPEDPNYDVKKLALECSAKRMYPDIISAKINREITGSSVPVSPMGCRSFLSVWRNENGEEVLDGRNNLGVVSLNLPRIAIQSEGDLEKFNSLLEERLLVCKDALMIRINRLKGVKASVAPILYTEGAFGVKMNPDDEILDLFRNGRASISLGYIGLHEVGMIMFGEHAYDKPDVQEFLKNLVMKLKETTQKWKEETTWGFSLYSTPSESLCDRFCRLDKDRFGEIAGITDKGWYTNSFHLDVDKKVTPFEKILFEQDYHRIASGGFISYAEFPSMKNNLDGLEAVWDWAVANLGYFGTNLPSDNCFLCGFDGEFTPTKDGYHCPKCGNKDSHQMSVVRRTCGYLGVCNARPFIEGKQREVIARVKHVD